MWSLPIGLGETSERAFPAWAVSQALECTLLRIKVPHGPVRTADQDLPAEKAMMEEEQGCPASLSSGLASGYSPGSRRRCPSSEHLPPPPAAAVPMA